MKALKALVIGMALLIVVGLGFMGYGLYRNGAHKASPPSSAAVHPPLSGGEPATAGAPSEYFSVELPVAAGTHLEQMTAAGDKLVLRFSGAEGERILVVDPQSGRTSGTIRLVPQTK